MPNYDECEHFGIDPKIVARFESRITKLLKDMAEHKLFIFCGSSNSIRAYDYSDDDKALLVGDFAGNNTEGGCGAASVHPDDGLLRGE